MKKTYAGPPEVQALHGVDLKIHSGDFAAIIGPSGSGKSTLLNVASGLEMPSQGRVFLTGIDVAEQTHQQLTELRRHKLSFVFQSFNLFPVLSAVENVEYPLLIRGDRAADARQAATEALALVGLSERAGHLPSKLSGGQQQRVAVARAIAMKPAIIFADEPTANLDSRNALQLIELFVTLNAELGMTFLLSTHDHRIVDRAARRIQIEDGRIIEDVVVREGTLPQFPKELQT
ncbi:MAG: ABC transporter ATP-binding protein [Bdellovibrionales bacterium]|nr:ABC transporter ATP-binding protein [Bdellovibrionales bacterium]